MERRSADMLRREIVEREQLLANCRRCGRTDLVPLLTREVRQLRTQLETGLRPEKFGQRASDDRLPRTSRNRIPT